MPIRIRCQHCDKTFSAWDDLVGKSVQCPKCKQSMVLPGAAPADDGNSLGDALTLGSPPATPSPPSLGGAPSTAPGPSPPRQKQPVSPQRVAPPPAKPSPGVPPAGPVGKPLPSGGGLPAASEGDLDDFDDREDLPFGCPKCNAEMEPDDDLCNACGYHLILKKVIDMEGVHRPDTATGFDRVVKKHLDDSESTAGMLLWAKLGGLFFLVLLCFVCLGPWGLAIGVVLLIGYFVYAARLRVLAEDNPDTHVERDPIASIMWSTVLASQRMFGWRDLQPPFAKLRVATHRDRSFGNDDLSQIEDLKKLQVLDLQGTGVTDAGLRHLKGRKKLCFLVLKDTAVTPTGVERLQQSIPTAWIWY